MAEKGLSHQIACAARQVRGRQAAAHLAIVEQGEADIGSGQRDARKRLVAMREFGRRRFEEFAPRRRVEIQIRDRHHRAGCPCRRLGPCAARERFCIELPGMRRVRRATDDRDARDCRDRGQRLAAKAVAGDALEVGQGGDLARRMTHQRERQVFGGDAATIIGDADRLDAAFGEVRFDARSASIEAVLDEFFEDRGRALDDFAGGDLADQQVGQGMDARHTVLSPIIHRAIHALAKRLWVPAHRVNAAPLRSSSPIRARQGAQDGLSRRTAAPARRQAKARA